MPRRRSLNPTRPRFTLRLTDTEYEALRRRAYREHVPANTLIRKALAEHLRLPFVADQSEEPA